MSTQDVRQLLKDPRLFREEAFINGQWVKSSLGKTFAVDNPANGATIATTMPRTTALASVHGCIR